ncbi:anaerobic c4-dicarboxylate antiporter, DcuC family [Denitrovibrio acetiphilus DSM 12809]|uniref:Anaerobic c4-dicarboxylate antiporter, DcuC family n=1 Tax=Denitrovibrio acetiphilus (strain DSM 12809 / NBRC 114555 / N2460) TaxID=522772 RepID=D4H3U1_DENA2|nr:C4-dicarboxylate transporter DcuC [Denitrovibrio acetiphilus]ADD69193.1 anaerobic c4-dicarboxylate antiporter, DcuC family [Denitrovibrio acetiphilus DSM 12809]
MLFFSTLCVVVLTGYLIFKRYLPPAVLFASGLILMGIASFCGRHEFVVLDEVDSSGTVLLDMFLQIKHIMTGKLADVGLVVMSASGFAAYMKYIGAAGAMIRVVTQPLLLVRRPYFVLVLVYFAAQILNIFIPSASGLGILLMVSVYPVLVRIGLSPASVAAVIATAGALDMGPASPSTNIAAELLGIGVVEYFTKYQVVIAFPVMLFTGALHYYVQRGFDRRDILAGQRNFTAHHDSPAYRDVPGFYALFPMLPVFLLVGLSDPISGRVKLDVVSAVFLSMTICIVIEYLRIFNLKKTFAGVKAFFNGMGTAFSSIVMLIFAAQTFAYGLKAVGLMDWLLHFAQSSNVMVYVVTISLVGFASFITGSGNASFFGFSGFVMHIAAGGGYEAVSLMLPVQFATGLCRSISPVSGVVIAVAGVSEVDPIEIIKRTAIPMLSAVLLTSVLSKLIL